MKKEKTKDISIESNNIKYQNFNIIRLPLSSFLGENVTQDTI
jgi:hypothetical protein